MNNVQPIWADQYFKTYQIQKMGLNSIAGITPIKYYSGDRITQIIGKGFNYINRMRKLSCSDFFEKC